MNEGWIKLYRKALESDIFEDVTAWRIFTWLLLKVDYKTGKKKIGRIWASEETKLNPSTFYKGLLRLQNKYKIIKLSTGKVTIKYTEIEVINWEKYQSGNNQVTIKEQSSNTLQEVKNKELRNKREYLLKIPLEDTKALSINYVCTENQVRSKGEDLFNYCMSKGKVYKDYSALLRNAVKKDFGERGKTQNAVDIIARKEREIEEERKNYKPFIVDYTKIVKRMDDNEVPF